MSGETSSKRKVGIGVLLAALLAGGGYWLVAPEDSETPEYIPVSLHDEATRGSGDDSESPAPEGERPSSPLCPAGSTEDGHLCICSFNVQFLGSSASRDNAALADAVAACDVLVVQELVAPPYEGEFPDGTAFKPDDEAAAFYNEMKDRGFEYRMSEEDTGTSETNHNNGSATEWWVAFYHPERAHPADDVPTGFIADDVTANPNLDRVPFAFGFRTPDKNLDFVLVSVHLHPDPGPAARARRETEMEAIGDWIESNSGTEKDIIVLGDMNIYKQGEMTKLVGLLPEGYQSLNDDCVATNTNVNGLEPYDHVMYSSEDTSEVVEDSFTVLDLSEYMEAKWTGVGAYPGNPYIHDRFRAIYSDHNPVAFEMVVGEGDDD